MISVIKKRGERMKKKTWKKMVFSRKLYYLQLYIMTVKVIKA